MIKPLLLSFVFSCFLICFFTKSIRADDSCDAVLLSYKLCFSNNICKCRLFIDENGDDVDTFRFLYEHLTRDTDFENWISDQLCNHEMGNITGAMLSQQETINYDDLDEFYKLWIRFMSEHRECDHTNQYFDGVIKTCVCKQDKECTYIHPHDIEFHTSHYQLMGWIIIFLIAVVTVYFIKKARSLTLLFAEIKQYISQGF